VRVRALGAPSANLNDALGIIRVAGEHNNTVTRARNGVIARDTFRAAALSNRSWQESLIPASSHRWVPLRELTNRSPTPVDLETRRKDAAHPRRTL